MVNNFQFPVASEEQVTTGDILPVPQGPQSFVSDVAAAQPGELTANIQNSKWDQWKATVESQFDQSALGYPGYPGSVTRMAEEALAAQSASKAGEQKISAEEQNKRFPGISATEAAYPEVAQLRFNEYQRKQTLSERIVRGGDAGALFNLSAGLAGSLEPFNLAANAALGVVSGGASIPFTLRNLFLQNLAIGGVAAVPGYIQSQREGQTQDIYQTVEDVIKGAGESALLFKGLHLAAGATAPYIKSGYGRVTEFLGETKSSVVKKLGIAIAQEEEGKSLDLTPQAAESTLRQAGAVKSGTVEDPYIYAKLDNPADRNYHSVVDSESGQPAPLNDFGPGVAGTDRGQEANNLASGPENPYTGQVKQFEIPKDAKILDLDQTIAEGEGKTLIHALEKKFNESFDLPPETTLNQALNQVIVRAEAQGSKIDVQTQIQDLTKEQGFQGFAYTNTDVQGNAISNHIHMFNEGDTIPGQTFEANKDTTPQVSGDVVKDQVSNSSPEKSINYDSAVEQKVKTLEAQPIPDLREMNPVTENNANVAENYLKELAKNDPDLKKELAQDAKVEDKTVNQNQSLAKLIGDCMTGGGQ